MHLTCIFVVRRCLDIRLYLKEKLDLADYEKIFLKLKKDPLIISALFTTLENVFFSFFYIAVLGKIEDHSLSIRNITCNNEQDSKLSNSHDYYKAKTNFIYTNIYSEGESHRPQFMQWNKYTHGTQNHNDLFQVKRSYLILNEEERKQENEKENPTETRIKTLDGGNDRKLVDL